jgi:5-methylcytosine-specific restriction protein A
MPDRDRIPIPDGISAEQIHRAMDWIDAGKPHYFAESRDYDVLFNGRRYSPKPLIGIAAAEIVGEQLRPTDFSAGLKSRCFRILESLGFQIVAKPEPTQFPNEIGPGEHREGHVTSVIVNRYERDPVARAKCITYHGCRCSVCEFDFAEKYGRIGEGFIHVHHLKPLAAIGEAYDVDPINDLTPVCPNCHAMMHRRRPPFSPVELKHQIRNRSAE